MCFWGSLIRFIPGFIYAVYYDIYLLLLIKLLMANVFVL